MNIIASKLDTIIEQFLPQLQAQSESECAYKPSPEKWSKKEIMGHLIDSAQSNIRRFIVAQYEENPSIKYDQDKWVLINNYQHLPLESIVQLWFLINKQIVTVLKNTSTKLAQRTCNGSTIEWLAWDYIKHLAHHVHQVLNLEPVDYP